MAERTLKQMLPGQKARVIRVRSKGAIGRRLMEMGVVPGCSLQIERFAPLGDPVEIKLRGYHLSLRKEEAGLVEVDQVEEA